MSALGSKLRKADDLVAFWCLGCGEAHWLNVVPDCRPAWEFNGNGHKPTFAPSILVTGVRRITDDEHARLMAGEHVEPTPRRCHSYVRDGRIQFLADCTHSLAGQTVELPDFPV